VLTLRCARVISWPARICAAAATVVSLSGLNLGGSTLSAAHADGLAVGSCVGSRYSITCVSRWGAAGNPYIRQVEPETEAEKALRADRDRKWEQRCQPLVYQDRYGVPRYEYAARGCEFGVIQ
jgi:hypothetical protein